MRSTLLLAVAAAWAVTVAVPQTASAHQGDKAEPRIAARIGGTGLDRTLTVALTDVDSREPIRNAEVTASAEMTDPHLMRTAPWTLPERRPGTYEAGIRFPMAADWVVTIGVSGEKVVRASAKLQVPVGRTEPTAPTGGQLAALPTRLEDDLTGRDIETMLVLWFHGLAAMGWIAGVVVMAIALSTRPGVLAEGLRTRLRDGYVAWGAWVHWSLVPAIVLTGIYNMLVVTPFPLAWRPSEIHALTDVPYGALYEAVLLVKLGLFAALLVTGTQVLARTLRAVPVSNPGVGDEERGFVRTLAAALGPPGVAYLATVPLILGAAMALRYVHILSHVGEVIAGA